MPVRRAPEGRQLLLSDNPEATEAEIKSSLGQNTLQTERSPTGVFSIVPRAFLRTKWQSFFLFYLKRYKKYTLLSEAGAEQARRHTLPGNWLQ